MLLIWVISTLLLGLALWWLATICHRGELRADRTAAELLGSTAPVLAMIDHIHMGHVGRSRMNRLCSLLTHPSPTRRRQDIEALELALWRTRSKAPSRPEMATPLDVEPA